MEVITFSLNLGTSNKNFETIKYSWKDLFERNKNIKKVFFEIFQKNAAF